jgi:S-layer protein
LLTTSADVRVGVAGGDDTFTGTDAAIGTANVIVDGSTTDADTLVVNGRAFQNTFTTATDVIANIETIDVNFDTLTDGSFNAAGVVTAAALDFSNIRSGSGATLTVTNVTGGSTITASDFNVITATADDAGDLTMSLASATGNITGTVSTTGNLTVVANASTGTIDANSVAGDIVVTANAAGVINADATGAGDITITSSANAVIDANSAGGNIVIVAASADDVTAVTSGSGTVNVTAEGDTGVSYTAKTATVTLSSADLTNNGIINATGVGTADSLTVNAGDDFTVAALNAIETITVSASSAVTATITTTAATTYVGDSNTTFAGSSALFTTATVSGADLSLTTVAAGDFSKASTTTISFDAAAGAGTYLFNNNANLVIAADVATDITIDADDDVTNTASVYLSGTLNLTLADDVNGGNVTIDNSGASDDGFDVVNLSATVRQTSLNLLAGTATVNVSGNRAITLDNTSTAGSINASTMTGVLTAEATPNMKSITAGSGADVLTTNSTLATIVINAGSGNDTVNIGGAATGTINGGDGTDTLSVTAAVDISGATITSFELLDINDNNVTVDESLLNGQSMVIRSTLGDAETITLDNITASTDLSGLSFADAFVRMNIDYASNLDATLGVNAAISVIGSSAADVIVGGGGADTLLGGAGADNITGGAGADYIDGGAGVDTLFGGEGNDTIIGGEGADTITGGAGNDTIDLTETTVAIDKVVFSGSTTLALTLAANGRDTITGFGSTDTLNILALAGGEALTAAGLTTASSAATQGALADLTVAILNVSGAAASLTTGGTAVVTDFTNMTQVSAFLSERYTTTNDNLQENVIVWNVGTTTYIYAIDTIAGGTTAIEATEIALMATVAQSAALVTGNLVYA